MAPEQTKPDEKLRHPVDVIVGNNIRRIREERELSQAALSELAKTAGLESFYPTTIARIEAGTRALRVSELPSLAQALEVSTETLLESRASSNARRLAEIQSQLQTVRARVRDAKRNLTNLEVNAEMKRRELSDLANQEVALRDESERLMSAGVDLTEHISLVEIAPTDKSTTRKK